MTRLFTATLVLLAFASSAGATRIPHRRFELAPHAASDGEPGGFDVVALGGQPRLRRMGLRVGDEVMRVNGHDFSNSAESLAAYDALTNASASLDVDVVRGADHIELHDAPVAQIVASPSAAPPLVRDLAGPWDFSLALGGGAGVVNAAGAFGIGFGVGYDLLGPTSRHHVFIDPMDLSLSFASAGTGLSLGPSISGNIALPTRLPLYFVPRFGAGIAFGFPSSPLVNSTTAFDMAFALGVKYILDGRWDFSFSPVNITVVPAGSGTVAFQVPQVTYWVTFGTGVHF
jgi:hypothetical protein